jgi:biopolymer transport protein ExbD
VRPRRLEAEVIRDALLAVGASLDTTMYGPSILDNTGRRSVYLRVKRSELIPFMTMFDAPEPTQSIGERISTTVPTQALAMMNSPFVRQQAERLAQRIRPAPEGALATAIDNAYKIALCRLPATDERDRMLAFIEGQRQAAGGDSAQHTTAALIERLKKISVLTPQPEVQIRGDGGADYESVGRIIYAVQRAGIAKVGFITEPPARS